MLVRLAWAASLAGTTAANVAVFAENPLARPMIERTEAEIAIAFDRAVARTVTPDWLLPRLDAALADEDTDTALILKRLAEAHAIPLPPETAEDLADLEASQSGAMACLACAWEVGDCPDLTRVAACNLPFELTPFGDLNALRRGARDYLAGEDVDELDVALGAVGLTATAAVVVSGGTSLPVKAGATLLRAARRAGALAPRMADDLVSAARGVIRWDRASDVALGRASAEALIDTARASRLTDFATDATRIAANTSATDALALLRLADDPGDLTRIARLSDAAGSGTRPGLHALGTARAFRLLSRLSETVILALGLATALIAQIATLAGHALARTLARR